MFSTTEPSQLISQIKDLQFIVIGDAMLDGYFYGAVNRISPEAPVPLVDVFEHDFRPGGAANVALNLKSLGCIPILIAVVGNDVHSKRFFDQMADNHLDITYIFQDTDRPTTTKTRIYGNNQYLLRFDNEKDHYIKPDLEQKIISSLDYLIRERSINGIIFEDYDKGLLTPKIISHLMELALKYGIPTFVDPKKRNFWNYTGATVFKPNLKELTESTFIPVNPQNPSEIRSALEILQKKLNATYFYVTLGEYGGVWTEKENISINHVKVHSREVLDVSGAGDTVIATLAAVWSCGFSPGLCFEVANLAGGIVVEEIGVRTINPQKLIAEINSKLPGNF